MGDRSSRFSRFNVHETFYKTLETPAGPHNIKVVVLIPTVLKPGKHPLFVKFHGGGLVLGEANYPEWFAAYLVPFVLRNNAVVVLPNYRLMPEHNGADIMRDVKDFWTWVDKDLQSFVNTKNQEIEIDFRKTLVDGDSAGGLLALNTVLIPALLPKKSKIKIRGVLAHYPMTSYLQRKEQSFCPDGSPAPGKEILETIAQLRAKAKETGTVISSSIPWKRFPISYALSAFGEWMAYFGHENEGFLPFNALNWASYNEPTLILHGEQDTAVSIEDSKAFVQQAESILGQEAASNVRLVMKSGDHGFDIDLREEENKWLRDELMWLEDAWLGLDKPRLPLGGRYVP